MRERSVAFIGVIVVAIVARLADAGVCRRTGRPGRRRKRTRT